MPRALKKKEDTSLVAASMYEADAQAGFEEADKDAYAIPFLTILQALSPQCLKTDGAYIKGAEAGLFYNTVSEQFYPGDTELTIIPVHYKRAFVEWGDRASGGGFVAEHNVVDGQDLLKQCTKNEKKQDVLPNGNLLVDTRSHYVLVVKEDSTEPAMISMSSTQMKKSRRWMTVMQEMKMTRADGSKFTPPMFSHMYTAITVPESNDQGSWYGWKIAVKEQVTDASLYDAAKSFRDAIQSGEAKEQAPGAETVEEEF